MLKLNFPDNDLMLPDLSELIGMDLQDINSAVIQALVKTAHENPVEAGQVISSLPTYKIALNLYRFVADDSAFAALLLSLLSNPVKILEKITMMQNLRKLNLLGPVNTSNMVSHQGFDYEAVEQNAVKPLDEIMGEQRFSRLKSELDNSSNTITTVAKLAKIVAAQSKDMGEFILIACTIVTRHMSKYKAMPFNPMAMTGSLGITGKTAEA